MKTKSIVFDCDDTTFLFSQSFIPFHNDQYNTNVQVSDFTDYEWHRVLGCEPMVLYQRVHEFVISEYHLEMEPIPGVADLIEYIRMRGLRLVMATSRPESHREYLEILYNKYFPGVFDVSYYLEHRHGRVGGLQKVHICKQENAIALFDDALHHVVDTQDMPIQAFVPTMAWNEGRIPGDVIPLVSEVGNPQAMWQPAYDWLYAVKV